MVQQFLHRYWYTLSRNTCWCEQVVPRSAMDARHILAVKPPTIIKPVALALALWAIWKETDTCHEAPCLQLRCATRTLTRMSCRRRCSPSSCRRCNCAKPNVLVEEETKSPSRAVAIFPPGSPLSRGLPFLSAKNGTTPSCCCQTCSAELIAGFSSTELRGGAAAAPARDRAYPRTELKDVWPKDNSET